MRPPLNSSVMKNSVMNGLRMRNSLRDRAYAAMPVTSRWDGTCAAMRATLNRKVRSTAPSCRIRK